MVELDSGAVSSRRGRAAGSRANGKGGSSLGDQPALSSPRILYPYACARSAAKVRAADWPAPRRAPVKNSRLRDAIKGRKKIALLARILGIRDTLADLAITRPINGRVDRVAREVREDGAMRN